jgi:hypothetical protein
MLSYSLGDSLLSVLMMKTSTDRIFNPGSSEEGTNCGSWEKLQEEGAHEEHCKCRSTEKERAVPEKK